MRIVGLEVGMDLRQVQTLRMTPRLQQSINMLQMTTLELTQLIEQELETNPTLEIDSGFEVGQEPDQFMDGTGGQSEEDDSGEANLEALNNEGEEFETHVDDVDINWEEFFDDAERTAPGKLSEDEQRDPVQYENFLSRMPTLREHLLTQLRLSVFNDRDYMIGEFLIGNINSRGYLTISVEEAAEYTKSSVDEVKEVLEIIQGFDPPGVGARNLAECLLIQYRQLHPSSPDEFIEKLIMNDLEDLSARKYKQLAKKYDVEVEEIQEAHDLIVRELNPSPGLKYSSDDEDVYIVPDVIVEKKGDEYVVTVNDGGIPKLTINPFYQKAVRNRKFTNPETLAYIKKKLDAAKWLLESIEQRRETIRKVATSIVKFQRDFLEHGISHFKPLTLRKVAEDIGMHESTVSRVTTNKYMQTPSGIYELKFFFSSSLQSSDGESSSVSVKSRIKELIEKEDPRKPLSDQAIVEILEKEGISIARRTVTKYREEMKIESSSRRKRY